MNQFAPVLAWNASGDSGVTGYKLYCGTVNQPFTNAVYAGNQTNIVVPGLAADTTYFFAATAVDSAGDESPFSNVTAYKGENAVPAVPLTVNALPYGYSTDPLVYSLESTAPAGATINPRTGLFSWTPSTAYTLTTNLINVDVVDTANAAQSITETLVVVVGDYLQLKLGTTAVLAGQGANLPLTVAASSSLTNLQFALNWPSGQLLQPTLNIIPPATSGTLQLQSGSLVGRLTVPAGSVLSSPQQLGQISFLTSSNQAPTTVYSLGFTAASGSATNASAYANVSAAAGEVVIVGNRPLLRPQSLSTGRALSLYANPGTYQLLYTTSLRPPVTWLPVLNYQQTNAVQNVSVDASIPQVFYQILQVSPQ